MNLPSALMTLWVSSSAVASESGAAHAAGRTPLGEVLLLVLLVAAAYLLTHFVIERLQRWLLFTSGAEFIILGLLLGPVLLPQLQVLDNLTGLAPIIAFSVGWIGLLYGMEFDVRKLATAEPESGSFRLLVAELLFSGGLVAACAYAVLINGWIIEPVHWSDAGLAAGVLGCASAAGSSTAVELLSARYRRVQTRLLPMLTRTARLGDLLAIFGMGVLMATFRPDTQQVDQNEASFWFVCTMALGIGLGLLFSLFLGEETRHEDSHEGHDPHGENQVFLALVGIIVFAGGAAYFLQISELTVNLLLGAVLANTRHGAGVREALQTSLKPVALLLLIFAGVYWQPVDPIAGLLFSLGFIFLRYLCKALGTYLVALGTSMRRDLFRGLMAQGEAAIAIGLTLQLVYDGPAVDLVYTAILSSVIVNELFSPRLLKGLLVDAGELTNDVIPEGAS